MDTPAGCRGGLIPTPLSYAARVALSSFLDFQSEKEALSIPGGCKQVVKVGPKYNTLSILLSSCFNAMFPLQPHRLLHVAKTEGEIRNVSAHAEVMCAVPRVSCGKCKA